MGSKIIFFSPKIRKIRCILPLIKTKKKCPINVCNQHPENHAKDPYVVKTRLNGVNMVPAESK